jgi:hypothetical protein
MRETDLADFVEAALKLLDIPIEPEWMPAIASNLDTILRSATLVEEMALPDDVEPAPVFRS